MTLKEALVPYNDNDVPEEHLLIALKVANQLMHTWSGDSYLYHIEQFRHYCLFCWEKWGKDKNARLQTVQNSGGLPTQARGTTNSDLS